MKKTTIVLALCALLAMATSAFAANICTTLACVAPTDNINWGTQGLGVPFTVWGTPESWVSTGATGAGEIGVVGPTNFTLMQQGGGWTGNFSSGEYLIWNQDANNFTGNAGPIGVLFFNAGVTAAGAQIQADFYGDFVATVCDQDSNCFSENGSSTSNGDGSAIFLGIANDPNLQFLTYSVVDINGNNDEAIGTVYFAGGTPTPEPSSLLLLGSGLIGAVGVFRRKINL